MHRSSESIACLAAALAKAQAELTNPEKSLVATIRPNGPGIVRDSGARTLALRSDDGEGPRTPSWKFAPHCSPPVTILGRRLSSARLWPRLPPSVTRYAFLGCRLRSRTPGPLDELNAGSLQHTRDCRERRYVACVPPGFDVGYRIAMEAGGLRVSDGPV